MIKPVLPIVTLCIFISCSKGSSSGNDTIPPAITITSPANGQTFTAGQSINMSGSITDDKYIAEVHIHVSNTNTGALLMDVHLYPAGSTATFDQAITAVAGVNYKIQVIARDKAVNETINSVNASCN